MCYWVSTEGYALEVRNQRDVKLAFGHDLKASYDALPSANQILCSSELDLLKRTSILYKGKAFEYVQPIDAVQGYRTFPVLDDLAELARKLVSACA